ncbi:homocysteine S-methyltransferase family protein [Thalassospiraceae bacterium LMO-SO8]|nr:homocysteine S-methyltransferase family protein [Alphaproteobacteria bacterium LMO-S08]WND77602.1 homocysteine S-methyltransferase family protein [Thalassospiraceae bacterium LMO-SO8]
MATYRTRLPQLDGGLFLTDGGMETYLCFQRGIGLPEFASFPLLDDATGRAEITAYMTPYILAALAQGAGFVLETPTWRANADWGAKLGYGPADLARINVEAVALMADIRTRHETPQNPMVISGNIGPRGDGYNPADLLTPDAAEAYHMAQVAVFAETDADLVTAMTITHVGEAVGIARAAAKAAMPVVIAFTTETDGRLPEGRPLADAIAAVDDATGGAVAYYMINCAHPTHFEDALDAGADWARRIRGLRANASTKSHAELDNAVDLDEGNPQELGGQYRALRAAFPHFTVLGGCCGTDHRHVACIGHACRDAA